MGIIGKIQGLYNIESCWEQPMKKKRIWGMKKIFSGKNIFYFKDDTRAVLSHGT
jgi:hypothetical protein